MSDNLEITYHSYFKIFNPSTMQWECIVHNVNKEIKMPFNNSAEECLACANCTQAKIIDTKVELICLGKYSHVHVYKNSKYMGCREFKAKEKETKMTLNQNIIDAIREQPENVEWSTSGDIWYSYIRNEPANTFSTIIDFKWRIKLKPYEARHEIYIGNFIPRNMTSELHDLIIGRDKVWSFERTQICTKKFEIIVREVVE